MRRLTNNNKLKYPSKDSEVVRQIARALIYLIERLHKENKEYNGSEEEVHLSRLSVN